MKPIKEVVIETIMPKYLENQTSEKESLKLMDELMESKELRTRMNIMAAGLNPMVDQNLKMPVL